MEVIPKRFDRFGLTIHPKKTKLFSFKKSALKKQVSKGENTFDFLGFTHFWARTRAGYWTSLTITACKLSDIVHDFGGG
jgi:hypothetical protein